MKDKTIEQVGIEQDPFVEIKEHQFDQLQEVIKNRLPKAANLFNTLLVHRRVSIPVKMYTLHGDLSVDSWVLFVIYRADFGQEICISAPLDPIITDQIKSAFSSTHAIDWDDKFMIVEVESCVGPMLIDISGRIKGNATCVYPNYFYYMDVETASKITLDVPRGLELKNSIYDDVGIDFLVTTWKYSVENTKEYTRESATKCGSSGIFEGENCVSGVMLNYNGLLGMLYTSEKYRGKGLAPLCYLSLAKNMAEQGMIPASTVEIKNISSVKFHNKVGLTLSHECLGIQYWGTKW